jgi:hypothetical protein
MLTSDAKLEELLHYHVPSTPMLQNKTLRHEGVSDQDSHTDETLL